MSRPFSYHDKNMDVIGNILFIHSYIPYVYSTTRGFETYNSK